MKITDEELLEAYYSAINLNLDIDFILILEEEIKKRNLSYELNDYYRKPTIWRN